jgi:rRNA-processing protein FCF1
MANKRVVLDTNIWMYLAESPEGVTVVDELRRLQVAGAIDIMIPEPVRREFAKHRHSIAERYYKKLQASLVAAKGLAREKEIGTSELRALIPQLNENLQRAKTRIPNTIDRIEQLLGESQLVSPSDAERLRAVDRIENSNAPAKKLKPSSVGDCYIWEVVLRLLDRTDVAFCSSNSNDFSRSNDDRQLHPMLAAEVERKAYRLTYHLTLEELLTAVGAEVAARERVREAEEQERRLARAMREIEKSIPYGKDGLDYSIICCDECGEQTVVVPNPKRGPPRCANCRTRFPEAETCAKCGQWLLNGLQDISVCDECLKYALESE